MALNSFTSFPLFVRLPVEIRLAIWELTFHHLPPMVGHLDTETYCTLSASQTAPSSALASRESYEEWLRRTTLHETLGELKTQRLFSPRLVILTRPEVMLAHDGIHRWAAITHIAFEIAGVDDVFELFESLVRFASLQTIIVIIPSGIMTDPEILEWQASIIEDQSLLRRLSALVDHESPDGEWGEDDMIGWILRYRLGGEAAREFYSRRDGPKVKVLIRPPQLRGTVSGDIHTPWTFTLFE
ncbi:uncharacterized protein F5Z01DRAFT_667644 [Emericellopsis atlantica]|uniref:2EXR domain-containing protein n=1 Tax=Emericellopsis atlantica TaxID=2614577 RepID=A0A9P7ZD67_9HYPO|nr:uncharacterized protein F5Z01DRAFT_667644 [Emericellopsis atlantica]KAG9249968.1 hypothetical protein F5Z01DRAFT_667644 [Emericellopsis atlantica]